jgi:hypothetical protein
MAKLGDFFTEGDEVLADVTFDGGDICNGMRFDVPLSKPANRVNVEVTESEGAPNQRDHDLGMRVMFDRWTFPRAKYSYFPSTEAGTDLNIRLERNPADTNQSNNQATKWELTCRPASGTWSNNHDAVHLMSTNGNGVRLASPITAGSTAYESTLGTVYMGLGSFDDGTQCMYSTTQPQDNGLLGYVFEQRNKYRDKWLGYNDNQTWISTIAPHDVIFHVQRFGSTGYNNQLCGQVVGEVDDANNRIRGIGVTNGTVAKQHQLPYDVQGTNMGNLTNTNGHFFVTKGYKMTATEQGTSITTSGGGTSIAWTSATTYTNDWNHYVGGVVKIWDGINPDAFWVGTLSQATGTTSCAIIDGTSYGGYSFVDGVQVNYELWLWYDFVGGDDGYTPISLTSLPADTWGTASAMRHVRASTQGTPTDPYRGAWYRNDPTDYYLNGTSVMYRRIEDTDDTNWSGAGALSYLTFYPFDFTGLTTRTGDDWSAGIPVRAGELITSDWGDGFYSPNGTDWYKSLKDNRTIGNTFGHHSGALDTMPPFWERRWTKYEGGVWYINESLDGATTPDREVDPVGAKAEYEKETWVATSYTDINQVELVLSEVMYRFWDVWTWTTLGNWDYEYNTRILNNSDVDQVFQYAPIDRYNDDWMYEFQNIGLNNEGMKAMYTLRDGAVRYSLNKEGTVVTVFVSPLETMSSVDSADNFTYGKTRVLITGQAK